MKFSENLGTNFFVFTYKKPFRVVFTFSDKFYIYRKLFKNYKKELNSFELKFFIFLSSKFFILIIIAIRVIKKLN